MALEKAVLSKLRSLIEADEVLRRSTNLKALLLALEHEIEMPYDPSDPLAQRAAWLRAATLLQTLHGDNAIAVAESIEKRSGRAFARVVTRVLQRMKREAERQQRGEP